MKKPNVYIAYCLLIPFGILGLHKFYIKRKKTGYLYIACTLIVLYGTFTFISNVNAINKLIEESSKMANTINQSAQNNTNAQPSKEVASASASAVSILMSANKLGIINILKFGVGDLKIIMIKTIVIAVLSIVALIFLSVSLVVDLLTIESQIEKDIMRFQRRLEKEARRQEIRNLSFKDRVLRMIKRK